MQKITIIWATDWFGKWLASFLLKDFIWEVELTITWRNKEKWENAAKEIWAIFSSDNISSVLVADIVIFAVPIDIMEKTIRKVAPHIKSWSLALDICSIKSFPSKALKESCKLWVTIIPTHPMFGPFVSSIAGQIFVLTPEEETKKDDRYKFLVNYLKKSWAKVIESTPKEHDKMMAVVQWLTHFDMFVLWETISRLNLDIAKSMDFVSPIYKIIISSVARYVWQNPKLYGDIQMYNKEVLEVHKVFMNVTNDFNRFVREKDEISFINTINSTKLYFWNHADFWQKYTDKIIYMMARQIEKAQNNVWNKVELLNIYSRLKINWELENYADRKLYFKSWEIYSLNEWEII